MLILLSIMLHYFCVSILNLHMFFYNFAIILLFFCLNDFYFFQKDGNTPLLIAIKKGYDAVATTLLDKGVDVNATNKVNTRITMTSSCQLSIIISNLSLLS